MKNFLVSFSILIVLSVFINIFFSIVIDFIPNHSTITYVKAYGSFIAALVIACTIYIAQIITKNDL